MPLWSNDLKADPWNKVLFIGEPKAGKSANVIATAPDPYVIACEDPSMILHAARMSKKKFPYEVVTSWESMEKIIKEARDMARAKEIQSIVVDPFSNFARHIEKSLRQQTDNDARRWSDDYCNRLDHVIEQIFRIPAHALIISHYIDSGTGVDGEEKVGEGRVPLLAGKARKHIAAKFPNVVFVSKRSTPKEGPEPDWVRAPYNGYTFATGPEGVWGPGCRGTNGTYVIPADVRILFQKFAEDFPNGDGPAAKKPNGAVAVKKAVRP